MRTNWLAFALAFYLFGLVQVRAGANAQTDVVAAIQKLISSQNYSWCTEIDGVGESLTRSSGPNPALPLRSHQYVEGQLQSKDLVMLSIPDFDCRVIIKDKKIAVKVDGKWQTDRNVLNYLDPVGGPKYRWIVEMARSFEPPAERLQKIIFNLPSIEVNADKVYKSELSAKIAVTAIQLFDSVDGPRQIENASGVVKFWLVDGKLVKFVLHVSGKDQFSFFSDDVTTEFKNVKTTEIKIPESAKPSLDISVSPFQSFIDLFR